MISAGINDVEGALERLSGVLSLFGVGADAGSWAVSQISGLSAVTFVSGEWILQLKTGDKLPRDQYAFRLFPWIDLVGVTGVVREVVCELGGGLRKMSVADAAEQTPQYWTLQRRIPGTVLDCSVVSAATMIGRYKQHLPLLVAELSYLHRVTENVPARLRVNAHPTRGLVFRGMSTVELLVTLRGSYANAARAWAGVDWEPISEVVLSHGDPILKNFVYDEGSSTGALVDWETLAFTRKHLDYVHSAAYVCKYLVPDEWRSIPDAAWTACRDELHPWDESDWGNAMAWGLLRQYLSYPPMNDAFDDDEVSRRIKAVPDVFA